ncbi:MAG: DUF6442 family protein [Gallicola sp.]|nr:DUF6442 family protein [Gallicola sp.]
MIDNNKDYKVELNIINRSIIGTLTLVVLLTLINISYGKQINEFLGIFISYIFFTNLFSYISKKDLKYLCVAIVQLVILIIIFIKFINNLY